MFNFFTGWAIASAIFYILVVLFILWMIYRFVKAHESIAKSMKLLTRNPKQSFEQDE